MKSDIREVMVDGTTIAIFFCNLVTVDLHVLQITYGDGGGGVDHQRRGSAIA